MVRARVFSSQLLTGGKEIGSLVLFKMAAHKLSVTDQLFSVWQASGGPVPILLLLFPLSGFHSIIL